VQFLLSANPGAPALTLGKVASGGELARAMLALRLVLTGVGDDAGRTLVFDEVDAGIGGAAASAVAAALAEVAARHQVLVVTHLAQVAAVATAQLVVRKEVHGDGVGAVTTTTVSAVEGDARVAELARMLSGEAGGAAAQRHAAELLAGH
jgi:DNA repair protein RecN (Recombination protein N)